MKRKGTIKKGIAWLMTAVMVFSITPVMAEPIQAQAEETPSTTKTIAGLGTSVMKDPTAPTSDSDAWKGSYVYYGNYDSSPVKYRVLDANTTDYSADGTTQTMLLDCDSILYYKAFDSGFYINNEWEDSSIYTSLNGADFLNKEGVFTTAEKNAIATSTVASHALTTDSEKGVNVADWTKGNFEKYVALTGKQIFLLDAEDVSNGAYGYSMTNSGCENRKKTGSSDAIWWLRSAHRYTSSDVGCVNHDGGIIRNDIDNAQSGVSPAFNVNLSSVLFSSVIPGTAGETGAEYKLTLLDSDMTIETNGDATRNGKTVTIPYSISGTNSANATQVSVLVLDKEYTAGNTNGATVLDYQKLNVDSFSASGTGTFALPSGLTGTLGTDYYIYLLAEHVNDDNSTDYASEPKEVTAILDEVDTVAVRIDTPIAEQPLKEEITVSSEGVAEKATLTWKKNGTEVTGNAQWKTTYQAYVTLTAADGYVFMDATGNIASVTLNGQPVGEENITLNEDGTLTVACGEYTTATRKTESATAPEVPTQFANYYTADNVLSSTELGTIAKVTLEGSTQPNPEEMEVEWSLANENDAAYDATPTATNTFKWIVKESEYADYDKGAAVLEGTVTIQNKDYTSEDGSAIYTVTETGENGNAVTYEAPTDKNATTVVIPATVTIDNITYKVTAISDTAFAGNKKLTSVTIGDNVTSFSAKTFKGCTNLKTLVIGKGVKSIPANAFKNFKKLATVKMETGVKTVGKNAFYGCSKLKNLTIGKNVTTIGDKAFYKCTALTKVTIPSKVKTIGKSAFEGCTKVTSITIGKNVNKIGSKAFYGCSKLKTLTIKSTKLTTKKIGSKAFSKTPKSMTVKVPKKKFKAYKSMLIKRGVNKKAKFKKI